jgi:hypothetical protein
MRREQQVPKIDGNIKRANKQTNKTQTEKNKERRRDKHGSLESE